MLNERKKKKENCKSRNILKIYINFYIFKIYINIFANSIAHIIT